MPKQNENSDESEGQTIAQRIRKLGMNGFGGACRGAAKKLNRKVFGGRGQIVGVANKFWLNRGRFLGHVAVLYDGHYWDTDGRPKDRDDIESWGMLAPDDPDYFAPGWNETTANEVTWFDNERAVDRAWQKKRSKRRRIYHHRRLRARRTRR